MKKVLMGVAILALAVFGIGSGAFANTVTVDGNPADWGTLIGTDTLPTGVYGTTWSYENFDDSKDGLGYHITNRGPGYGGQSFDVEGVYLTLDSTNAYIGVLTGFPSAGYADARYTTGLIYPGDIQLSFSNGNEFGIKTLDTDSAQPYWGVAGIKGDLWSVTDWNKPNAGTAYEGLLPTYEANGPASIKTGVKLQDNLLKYTQIAFKGADGFNRYFIEYGFAKNIAGMDWTQDVTVHWTTSCGNDMAEFTVSKPVPEPISSSLFLLGAGAFGLKMFRKKKKA